jgi:RecG-like helicase
MDVFNSLTKNQQQKLVNIGLKSWYEVLGYTPFRIQRIVPFREHSEDSQVLYVLNGVLQSFHQRKNYFLLDIDTGSATIQLYFFRISPYTRKILYSLQGKVVQTTIRKSSGFWSIDRLSEFKGDSGSRNFILGKGDPDNHYLVPVYHSQGALKSAFFETVHRRQSPSSYRLDIKGLLPENNLLPEVLNLYPIHHPTSLHDWQKHVREWKLFNLYLRFSLVTYHEKQRNHKRQGKAINIDLDFLKGFTSDLPFELSPSQKLTIWELLQEISVD